MTRDSNTVTHKKKENDFGTVSLGISILNTEDGMLIDLSLPYTSWTAAGKFCHQVHALESDLGLPCKWHLCKLSRDTELEAGRLHLVVPQACISLVWY